jgi:hypothetical protein
MPATIRSMATVKSSKLTSSTRRCDRGLVDQVGEIGAGEARGQCGHLLQIHIPSHADLAHVDLEDRNAPALVGTIDQHLTIEPAGAKQRGIEDFRPVGGGEQDDA